MILKYADFCEILKAQKLELQFVYENFEYWIIVNDVFRFIDNHATCICYRSSSDLLNAKLINQKKLIDIWNDLIILSFDYGWHKTINIKNN